MTVFVGAILVIALYGEIDGPTQGSPLRFEVFP